MSTTTQRRTADDWANFIEQMKAESPTTQVDDATRALLAVALCDPGWAPRDVWQCGPQAVWELLSREQWAGLLLWSQARKQQVIH